LRSPYADPYPYYHLFLLGLGSRLLHVSKSLLRAEKLTIKGGEEGFDLRRHSMVVVVQLINWTRYGQVDGIRRVERVANLIPDEWECVVVKRRRVMALKMPPKNATRELGQPA
jgi:hypothetical protein